VLVATPDAPSGVYTIDPSSSGSGGFEVACDMTTMAGWTLVARERLGTPGSAAGPLRYLGIDSQNPPDPARYATSSSTGGACLRV
jgi:hypothetical protein